MTVSDELCRDCGHAEQYHDRLSGCIECPCAAYLGMTVSDDWATADPRETKD